MKTQLKDQLNELSQLVNKCVDKITELKSEVDILTKENKRLNQELNQYSTIINEVGLSDVERSEKASGIAKADNETLYRIREEVRECVDILEKTIKYSGV